MLHFEFTAEERRELRRGLAKRAVLLGVALVCCAVTETRAGELLVADRLNNEVFRYSSSGVLLGTVVGPAGGLNSNLNQPTGIGISPDGKELYVSSSQNNLVMRYDYNAATGTASNPQVFADASGGLSFPNDIKFSPSGSTVYVANLGGGGVSRFYPDGTSAGSNIPLLGDGSTEVASMNFTSDGRLLAAAFLDSSGVGGAVAVSDASISSLSDYLVQPTSAITGTTGLMVHDGYLYASGLFTGNIRRFAIANGQIDPAWGISGLGFPQDLAPAPDGNGFLAGILGFSSGMGNIARYGYDGTFLGTFAAPGNGGFDEATAFVDVPTPLAGDFNGDGVVNAADYVVWRKLLPNLPLSYGDWRANFGNSVSAGAGTLGASAVPEPADVLLLIAALLIGVTIRNRN